ncbi:uncharacterized protein LOC106779186 [Vigna radiata var. radiata]|uniref:Uncharacterized protein LOC106779186 n=1 Tax=Vigna radiata var. radiata TaxID=3916 RepID=A0A3Q0EKL7_VIGRR|nr:uncharacterized protein LOC106779186 [Vigna radiata var. radiata]
MYTFFLSSKANKMDFSISGWEKDIDTWRRRLALENMGWKGEAVYYINRKSIGLRKKGRAAITVELCEMKKVHLQDLPNLRSFSSGDTLKWSSLLENVVLKDCPKVKKFGLGMIKESELKSILITENEEQIDPQTKLSYLFELLDDKLSLITNYSISNNQELYEILYNLQSSISPTFKFFRFQSSSRIIYNKLLIPKFIVGGKIEDTLCHQYECREALALELPLQIIL